MADNTLQNGTANIATDDIGGVHHPLTKMEFGEPDTATQVSATNPLPIVTLKNGVVSTANSSTTALLLGIAFTGVAEDVSEYSHIVASVFASHASATDGLQLQQSHDNVNWDFVESYTIPATTGKTFSVAVLCKWFRVVYTNGGIMQTAFRLATVFSKQMKKGSSVRPQDGRSNENDFEETVAFLMGYNGASWDRLKSRSGRLSVDTDSFRAVTFKGQAASFRIPGRAGTAGQKLFTIHNATGSTALIDVEKIAIDTVATVAKAVTVLPPAIRVYRITALPTGGTAAPKVTSDSAQTSNTSVTLLGDASADGTSSGTVLAATLIAGATSQIFAPRLITGAGYEIVDRIEFLNDDDEKITLRPGEGLCVTLDYVLATQNPITDMWLVGCKWTEYGAV